MADYFAVYKGDEIVTHGTVEEIAKRLEVSYRYAKWLSAPSIRKRHDKGERMVFVPVEELEE